VQILDAEISGNLEFFGIDPMSMINIGIKKRRSHEITFSFFRFSVEFNTKTGRIEGHIVHESTAIPEGNNNQLLKVIFLIKIIFFNQAHDPIIISFRFSPLVTFFSGSL